MALNNVLRIGKNTSMLVVGTMLRMVASFVFVIYCADQLGVEGFGKYSIATHFFELFLSLTATAVGIILTRDIARWPRHTFQLLTSGVLLAVGLCVGASITMCAMGVLFGYAHDTQAAMWVASIALLPASVCTVFEAIFVTRERAEFVTAGIGMESLLRIALSLWLLFHGFGLVALLWVVVAARLGLMLYYGVGLKRIGALGWSWHRRRSLRLINRWRIFAAENWMASIYTNLDVILLSWLSGEAAAGIYNAAWKVVRLGTVVSKSYTTAVFPVMSRMYAESRQSFSNLYRHTIRVMCALALPAIAVVSIVPERVIGLLFSNEFDGAAVVLRVLIWTLLIDFLNPFLSHALFAQGRQDRSMRVAGISLAVNSVLTYLLVTWFGAVGAALGTVIGGLVATICYLFFAIPKRDVLATGVLTLRVLVAASALAMVINFVREASWLHLALISVAVYVPLLFVVGALRLEDVRFFRTTFLAKAAVGSLVLVILAMTAHAQSPQQLSLAESDVSHDWIRSLSEDTRASILWRADYETGDLTQWEPRNCKDPGGGVFNTGGAAVTAVTSIRQAHSGQHSVAATITGAVRAANGARAVRLMRWTDRPWDEGGTYFPKSAYYSTWMYFPKTYNPNKQAPWDPGDGGWWNVFQFKADDERGASQPTWVLNIEHDDATNEMQFYLHSSINTPASVGQAKPVALPVGKWFHVEVFFQVDSDKNGKIIVWQDGKEILRAEKVQTAICKANEHAVWGIGNYTDHITGDSQEGMSILYFDDSIVATRRISKDKSDDVAR